MERALQGHGHAGQENSSEQAGMTQQFTGDAT
jgi:hypothetical protein